MEKLNNLMLIANSFDMNDITKRYSEEKQITLEVAKEHENELKKFLVLCTFNNARYGMAGVIDDLWHLFILDTPKYVDFCNKIAGKYIHHIPEEKNNSFERQKEITQHYNDFISDYKKAFQIEASKAIWPDIKIKDGKITYIASCSSVLCLGVRCIVKCGI